MRWYEIFTDDIVNWVCVGVFYFVPNEWADRSKRVWALGGQAGESLMSFSISFSQIWLFPVNRVNKDIRFLLGGGELSKSDYSRERKSGRTRFLLPGINQDGWESQLLNDLRTGFYALSPIK